MPEPARRRPVIIAAGLAAATAVAAVVLLPCGRPLTLLATLLIPLAAALGAYRLSPARSRAGLIVLLAVWALLAMGVAANLHQWTLARGCSLDYPLMTNHDAVWFRDLALRNLGLPPDHPVYVQSIPRLYDDILALLIRLFGRSILPPVILSMTCVMLAVTATGALAARIINPTARFSSARISTAAMIMVSALAQWLTSGTLILKDAPLELAYAGALLGMTLLRRPCATPRRSIILGACLMLSLLLAAKCRPASMLILAPAALLACRRRTLAAAIGVAAAMIAIFVATRLTFNAFSPDIYVDSGSVSTAYFQERPTHMPYLAIIGDYPSAPLAVKLLWLPVSCAVQFFIPLPWNALRDLPMAVTLVYAHQGWAWYIIGGGAIAYLAGLAWRRGERRTLLARWLWWGAAVYAVIALLFAGTVSRYALPLMPIFVCAALAALLRALPRALPRAESQSAEEPQVEAPQAEEQSGEEQLAKARLAEERLAEGRSAEGRSAEGRLAEERSAEGRSAEGRLAEEQLAEKVAVRLRRLYAAYLLLAAAALLIIHHLS